VEQRLLPVNALIALCTPGDMNPSPLHAAGFRLAALEVPVGLEPDKVVVDAVLWHPEAGLLVAAEGKSGANVEPTQAAKYAALDAQNVVHASSVDVQGGSRPTVAVLYAVLEHNVARIRKGLAEAGVAAPVLGVTRDGVRLHDGHVAHPLLAQALGPDPVALPWGLPRIIPCDHESPVDVVLPQVKAVVVAHSSRSTPEASAATIAEETLPQLLKYGRGARQRFVKTVAECLRRIAAAHPDTYEFRAATANHEPLLRFLKTPEDNDNRGRTQAYQALARDGRRRRLVQPDPGQLDLLRELGDADNDNVSTNGEDRHEEERP
jgi:hypothetical protein